MYVKILVGKSEGNRPLGTCRSKWMEILKWKQGVASHLAEEKVQWRDPTNTAMDRQVPKKSEEFHDQLRHYQLLKYNYASMNELHLVPITHTITKQ